MKKFVSFDIGNTHPNIALFHDGVIATTMPLDQFYDFQNYPHGLASVVGAITQETKEKLQPYLKLSTIKDQMFLDMPVHYTNTLGQDRLVSAYKIFKEHKGVCAIIDAGTFVTVDIVDERGFRGGYILPGPKVLGQSYQRGALLPTIELEADFDLEELPHSTQEAISKAMQLLYREFFSSFFATQKPQKIFLSGGQVQIMGKFIEDKSHLFHVPHLVHEALYLVAHEQGLT